MQMLCGKDAMENWKAVIDVDGKVLKVKTKMDMEGERVKLKMEETSGGHFGLRIGAHEEWKTEETVLFMEKEEDVKSYKNIKKVHETPLIMRQQIISLKRTCYMHIGMLTDWMMR